MSKLLTSYTIGSLELKNRMVMSPMTRCRAGEGGVPTSMNANYYQQRASAGLIVAEGTQISPQGVGYPATMVKGKRRERRKDERPAEILQAAVDEFAEKGFANAKIQSIATRAGVAKGTVYLYYTTKEEIFEAIVRDRIQPVFAIAAAMSQQWEGSLCQNHQRFPSSGLHSEVHGSGMSYSKGMD